MIRQLQDLTVDTFALGRTGSGTKRKRVGVGILYPGRSCLSGKVYFSVLIRVIPRSAASCRGPSFQTLSSRK